MAKATSQPATGLSTRRLLCMYQKPHGPRCARARTVLGRIRRWRVGRGYQQNIYCTRCRARGVVSCNTGDKVPPPAPQAMLITDARCGVDAQGRDTIRLDPREREK